MNRINIDLISESVRVLRSIIKAGLRKALFHILCSFCATGPFIKTLVDRLADGLPCIITISIETVLFIQVGLEGLTTQFQLTLQNSVSDLGFKSLYPIKSYLLYIKSNQNIH